MQGINEERVEAWMNTNIDGAQGPYTYTLIAGGRSNLTFHVVD
jgi:aminoglycoside phosphotransferase (APT) family kinase protein